jgi:GT2 family glycosyltransferase
MSTTNDMTIEMSAVIATYKRAALLQGTLEALAVQKVPDSVNWEIVVVDNHSLDETAAVVTAFSKTTTIPVGYVLEPRQGLSHARNRGIKEARGSIIAFIDDDVLPASDWIAQVGAAIDRWNAHGIGGRILPRWEAPPPPWLTERQHLMDRLAIMEVGESCVLSLPLKGRPQVWGANMAFRREVFEKVGGFDPGRGIVGTKLFRGEEVELVHRALEHGLRIVYDPAVTVMHRIGQGRLRKGYFRKMEFDAAQGEINAKSLAKGRAIFGVPLWLYPMVFTAFWKWIALLLFGRPGAFDQQLEWLRGMGRLSGYWKVSRGPRVES